MKEVAMTRTLTKIAFAVACLAAFAAGGAALAGAFDDDGGPPVSGADAAEAGSAAVRAAGGGEIVSVERSDDHGAAWDVEVRRDGREIEVWLDEQLRPAGTEPDPDDDVGTPGTRFPEEDDLPLTAEQARQAGQAALRVAGGGSVESVERSDDPGEAYEVEVTRGAREVDVALDEGFRPVRTRASTTTRV
jgi:uncharacterized membrane protein YkoI